jgi:hypothetical protein
MFGTHALDAGTTILLERDLRTFERAKREQSESTVTKYT